jgi:hypothetical protein
MSAAVIELAVAGFERGTGANFPDLVTADYRADISKLTSVSWFKPADAAFAREGPDSLGSTPL